jgi:hypothetical protein
MAQSQVSDPPTPIGMFRADLPAWVEVLIARALAKNPGERFQSAVEFHEAFARCLAGLPMTTLYASSAPTELMTTPPRAMPTGTMPRAVTSASLPPLTAEPQADLTPIATSSATMPAMAHPTPTDRDTSTVSAAPPAAARSTPTPAPPTATSGSPATMATPRGAKSQSSLISMVAVVGALLVGGAAIAWFFAQRSTAPAVVTDPPAAASVPEPTPSPAAPAPAETPPPTPTAPPTAAPSTGVPRGAPPSASTSRGAVPAPAPAPTSPAPAARGPVEPETPAEYKDVRLVVVTGRRSADQEGLLSFAGGQLTLLGRSTGAALASMPYEALQRATYIHARDPRWDSSLAGPPEDLDVGGIFRTAKHWLVLQGRDAYIIVRLEDNNWRPILNTVVDRTKVQITLAKNEEK